MTDSSIIYAWNLPGAVLILKAFGTTLGTSGQNKARSAIFDLQSRRRVRIVTLWCAFPVPPGIGRGAHYLKSQISSSLPPRLSMLRQRSSSLRPGPRAA